MTLRRFKFLTAILIIAAAPYSLAQSSTGPRLISVAGTAERRVVPDQVSFTVVVGSRERDLRAAKAKNDRLVRNVLAVIRKMGIDAKDVSTSAVSMGPEYSRQAPAQLIGFEVSQIIGLVLKDLSKYDALTTELLEAGVHRIREVRFSVGEAKKYRESLRLEALRAAKAKAAVMAAELGQQLGRPWSISEEESAWGGGSRVANTVAVDDSAGDDTGASAVAPGEVTIKVSVSVSFELQ